jgi:AcrR family transcriptional regulator
MSRAEKKLETRQRILDAAARRFRSSGLGGVGVDGLASAAGVTSGAFYVHFASKQEAFCAAVEHGLADLNAGVAYFQQEHGSRWWSRFVHFYLNEKRTCDLSESCSLQSLAAEVARADEAGRQVFEAGLQAVAQSVVDGPVSPGKPPTLDAALAALATLVGAVSLARAVASAAVADRIAQTTIESLLQG